ncbi:MAG: efflux RND transporter periplasmic adaptor subunit [Holosporales bacterium]|jgi:HlyD family secretion protein|nr:efflux RND transporter periplasmic adaptor subunit [Holosporales bacterium]
MNKVGFIISSFAIAIACLIGYKFCFDKEECILLNGNVEVCDISLAFRTSGRISSIMVNEGDKIKKGDVLASLDKDTFLVKVKYSNAKLNEEEVNFENAKQNYKRNKELFAKNSVSEKIYEDSKAAYEVSVAKANAARAMCEYTKIEMQDANLISPVDGIVLTKNIELGEMISSGIAAFSIMPDTQTKIKTFAGEEILSKIKYGDTVYVKIETMPEKKFKGHIGFISPEAEFTPKNIETKELRTCLMYRVTIIVDEPALELKQGMPVTVSYDE